MKVFFQIFYQVIVHFIRNECRVSYECEPGESVNHIMWLIKKEMNCPLFFVLFHTQQHTTTEETNTEDPISLSLLNHSNLFLPLPKIYIFHKLLQQGILQRYGLNLVPTTFFIFIYFFGQFELTHCVPFMALTHTHHGKNNSRKFTIKQSVVLLSVTPTDKVSITVYFTLVNLPIVVQYWYNLFLMRFPFKLYSWITEVLLNLNELYIRNSPHCHRSRCSERVSVSYC